MPPQSLVIEIIIETSGVSVTRKRLPLPHRNFPWGGNKATVHLEDYTFLGRLTSTAAGDDKIRYNVTNL